MDIRDFISLRDLSPSDIEYLLLLGRQIKARPSAFSKVLQGKTLALALLQMSIERPTDFEKMCDS